MEMGSSKYKKTTFWVNSNWKLENAFISNKITDEKSSVAIKLIDIAKKLCTLTEESSYSSLVTIMEISDFGWFFPLPHPEAPLRFWLIFPPPRSSPLWWTFFHLLDSVDYKKKSEFSHGNSSTYSMWNFLHFVIIVTSNLYENFFFFPPLNDN